MRGRIIAGAAAAALATAAAHGVEIEVVMDITAGANSVWGAWALAPGTFVATPDADAIAAGGGRLFVQNGNDTDDSDGAGILGVDPENPGVDFAFMIAGTASSADNGQTNNPYNLEFLLLNEGGFTSIANGGETFRAMEADAEGNVYIAFSVSRGHALVKVDATSDLLGTPSASVLSTDIEGARGLTVWGSTVYVLLLEGQGASEDKVVSFSTTGSGQQATLVFDQAALAAAGFASLGASGNDRLNGLATDGTSLFVSSRRGGIARLPLGGGAGSLVISSDGIGAAVPNYSGRIADEGIVWAPFDGNLYFATYDPEPAEGFNDFFNVVRLVPSTGAAEVFVAEADIENSPAYIAEVGGGEILDQSHALAVLDDWLYISVEGSISDRDTVVRARLAGASSVNDWMLYAH